MLQGNIPQSVSQLINLEYVFPTRRDGAVLVRGGNHAVVRQRCLSVNVTPMPVFQVSRRRLQPNERAHSRRRPLPQRTAVWQHLAPDGSLQFLFQQPQYTHVAPVVVCSLCAEAWTWPPTSLRGRCWRSCPR